MRFSRSPSSDQRFFRNTAKVHRQINLAPHSMRGGIRL